MHPSAPNNDECNEADNSQPNNQSGREQWIVSGFGAWCSRLKKCGPKPGEPQQRPESVANFGIIPAAV